MRSHVNAYESQPCEHGDATVLKLSLPQVVHRDPLGESKGVKADIPCVTLEVLGVGKEGEGGRLLSRES